MDNANNIYSPPKSELTVDATIKPSIWVVFAAIFLTLLLCLILLLKSSLSAGVPTLIPSIFASVMPAFVFVLVFQVGKRFRNSRSRWKIYAWCQFLFVLGQISNLLQTIGSNA